MPRTSARPPRGRPRRGVRRRPMRDFVDARDGASRAFASYCSRYWPAWCVLGVANCVMAVVCVWRRGSLVTRTNEPSVRGLAPLGMRASRLVAAVAKHTPPWARRVAETQPRRGFGCSLSKDSAQFRGRRFTDRPDQKRRRLFLSDERFSQPRRTRTTASRHFSGSTPRCFVARAGRVSPRSRARDARGRRTCSVFNSGVTTRHLYASSLSPPYSVLLFFQAYAASRILRLGAAPCSSGKM